MLRIVAISVCVGAVTYYVHRRDRSNDEERVPWKLAARNALISLVVLGALQYLRNVSKGRVEEPAVVKVVSESATVKAVTDKLPSIDALHSDLDILSPNVLSPDVLSPDVPAPTVQSPDVQSPDVPAPAVQGPGVQSPGVPAPVVPVPAAAPSPTVQAPVQKPNVSKGAARSSPMPNIAPPESVLDQMKAVLNPDRKPRV